MKEAPINRQSGFSENQHNRSLARRVLFLQH